MTLQDTLTRAFVHQLMSTPAGRAHLLNQIADAEDNGEAEIFDHALAVVDDPSLRKVIERHRQDEIEHGALFRAARDRIGVDPGPVPDELKILDRINDHLGGFFDRPLGGQADVVEAYLVLQVIEERAVSQFQIFAEIADRDDPELAALFRRVAADEDRHLRYCRAVVRRYGESAEATGRRLAELRRLEARAFQQTSGANVALSIERGYIRGRAWQWLWRTMSEISRWFDVRPMTRFALA